MTVYKQYSQVELDIQYNTRLRVPDYANYLDRWELLSRDTEQGLPVKKDLPYGDLSREILGIYPSPKPGSKTLIFIHGGYWHLLDKSMFQYIAKAFYNDSVTTVIINYPQAPAISMDQIVASCQKAVSWCYQNISAFNGDPDEMYLLGHSAGGHLTAMLLATDFSPFKIPGNCLKGACTASGLFDLIPIQLCYVGQAVNLDRETAIRNSPVNLKPLQACPLIVAVGDDESEEFKAQSSNFYSAWKKTDVDLELLSLPGENHYSIIETVVDSLSPLHLGLRKLMKL